MTEMSVYQLARKRLLEMPMNFAPPPKKEKCVKKAVPVVAPVAVTVPTDVDTFSARIHPKRRVPTEEELAAMSPAMRHYYRHMDDPGFMEKKKAIAKSCLQKAMKDPQKREARRAVVRKSSAKRRERIKADPKLHAAFLEHTKNLKRQSRKRKREQEAA